MRLRAVEHPALYFSVLLFTCIVAGCYLRFYDAVKPVFDHAIAAIAEEDEQGALTPLHPNDHIHREPVKIDLHWNVTKAYRRPDGVKKLVYLINGQFPGPNIEARSGDNLSVTVYNKLQDDEGIAIHWHGLFMRGANDMDGAVAITQNATLPGDSFTYEFQIPEDQEGTFWYHSHSELQRADGLYGGLVVHEPSVNAVPSDEEEKLLMVGDWYHRTAQDVQASYATYKSWGMEPVPDSLLINGRGMFNCSMAVPSRPLDCQAQKEPTIKISAQRQKLRIINVGAMSGVTVRIPGSEIQPFNIDGGNPVIADGTFSSLGVLYPGERIDVSIQWPIGNSDDLLRIELDQENYTFQNKALTPYREFPVIPVRKPSRFAFQQSSKRDQPHLDVANLAGEHLMSALRPLADQIVLIYTKIEMLAHLGNAPRGFLNHTSWTPQSRPLIETPRKEWDENQLVPWISAPVNATAEAKWVDIVVNNMDEKGHPFHLHGHDFYVLSLYKSDRQSYRTYNPFSSTSDPMGGPYNLFNPRRKDTIYIPPMGYAVLRIRADNPGLWFFHCHILWHQGAGMAMALQVGGQPP